MLSRSGMCKRSVSSISIEWGRGPKTRAAYRPMLWMSTRKHRQRTLTSTAQKKAHHPPGLIFAHSRLAVADVAAVDGLGRARIVTAGLRLRGAPVDAATVGNKRELLGTSQHGDGVFGRRHGKASFLGVVLDPGIALCL